MSRLLTSQNSELDEKKNATEVSQTQVTCMRVHASAAFLCVDLFASIATQFGWHFYCFARRVASLGTNSSILDEWPQDSER